MLFALSGILLPNVISFAESVPKLWRHVSAASATAWPSPGPRPGSALGAARATTTLRRLIGSSVVVGPATMPCRHEHHPGWPSADGAGSPGRRDRRPGYTPGWPLDPHRLLPVEPTNPGQRTVCFCQFGLACPVPAGRRADAARLAHPPKESLAPTSVGPWAVAAACREGRQAMRPVCPGGWCFVWGAPAERLDAVEALPPHCHALRWLQPPFAARRARRGRALPWRRRGRAARRRPRRRRARPQARRGRRVRPWPGCRPTR